MYFDDKYKKRKLITASIFSVIAFIGIIWGLITLFSYHRTDLAERNRLIASDTPTVVMFYKSDCPDCKSVKVPVKLAALKSKLSPDAPNLVYVEWHNKDDYQMFEKYGIKRTPSFMVFKNGQPQSIGKSGDGYDFYSFTGTDKKVISNIYTKLNFQ